MCRLGRSCEPPKHRDLAGIDRVVGQNIDREIQPLPRRVATHRRGTEDHAGEARVGMILQERLAHSFVLVVEREWNEWMVFGTDVRVVGNAVDRARRGIDEALHSRFLGRHHEGLEGIEVDRGGKILVFILIMLHFPPLIRSSPYPSSQFPFAHSLYMAHFETQHLAGGAAPPLKCRAKASQGVARAPSKVAARPKCLSLGT
jgi:hypothetical protein